MYGIPLWWSTGVFISQTCPQLSFSYYSIIVQIFLPGHWFSWRFMFMGFWPRQLWVFVFASVSSQLGGQQIVLWTHFSCRFKKNCWYVFFVQLFFFFFWLPHGINQGSNPSWGCNLCHSCGNTEFLTHCTGPGIQPASLPLQRHCRSNCTTVGTPVCTAFNLFW